MRIHYIADSYLPSRTANGIHVMKMCQAYARLGHDVTLIAPDWREGIERGVDDIHEFYGVENIFRIRKIFIPRYRSSTLYWGVFLPAVSRMAGPDLIHTRSLGAAWGAAAIFRVPTILETHSLPFANRRQKRIFFAATRSPRFRSLVVITRALAERTRELIGEEVPMLVAPDGVDASWLDMDPSRDKARRELGLADEKRRIAVYTGHLYGGRGIELIIEMARELPDHLFLVVGGHEDDVRKYRELAGDIDNLRLVGFVAPGLVPAYLFAADLLLMPYAAKVEVVGGGNTAAIASPMKMFEYMAAGRPIIASDLPVLGEVLEDENNAILVPYRETGKWIEAAGRLARDEEFAAGLGRRSRAQVEKYTWESRARRLLVAAEMD